MSLRLDPLPHEWIDRSRPLSFRFEGEAYQGYAGDTVTSALWAAGARVLGRSFKYHRPRGILSGANHDANLIMQDGERLNLRADVEPLQEGMDLVAVNTQGGVKHDRLAVMGRFSRFMPAGFYGLLPAEGAVPDVGACHPQAGGSGRAASALRARTQHQAA